MASPDPTNVSSAPPALANNIFTVIFNNYKPHLTSASEAKDEVLRTGKNLFRPSGTDKNALTLTYQRVPGFVGNARLRLVDDDGGSFSESAIKALFPGELSGGRRKTRRRRTSRRKTHRRCYL